MYFKNCVYRFVNESNKIIYIGKAKNLKNRLGTKEHKSKHLPDECYKQIALIQYVTFETENDMEFAEKYYIQKYKPKFNSVLANKQITIEVPALDKRMWFPYYRDIEKIQNQLNSFENNEVIKLSEHYSYVDINTELDIFEYVIFYTMIQNHHIEDYNSYKSYMKEGDLYGREELKKQVESYKTFKNYERYNKIEERLIEEIEKSINEKMKRYPLLNYSVCYKPQEIGDRYHDNYRELTISEWTYTLRLGENYFKMDLTIYGREGTCNGSCEYCSRFSEVNNFECQHKPLRLTLNLHVNCNLAGDITI